MDSLNELFHKEKYQKKNNMTTGQIDNLKKYTDVNDVSIDKSAIQTTDDKQIKRELKYQANIHIDETVERLASAGLLLEQYQEWYFKSCHTLGAARVAAMADKALTIGKNPQALFHFMLNKEMNKALGGLPRFNR